MDNMAEARNHLHEMEAKKKADSNKKNQKNKKFLFRML